VVPFRAGDQLPAQRLAVTVDDIELGERRIDHPSHLAFYVPPHPWDGDTMRITLGHPDAARPVDLGISDEGRKLAFAVHAVRFVKLNQPLPDAECRRSVDWLDVASAADSRVAIATAEAGLGIPISAMLMGFTSLGDNCEFGIFQRQCATEPLGLLRFSTALLEPVIRGIDTGFEGLGEPGDIAPHVAMGAWAEWMIHEKRYGLAYHTEIREENATAEQVLAQETVKLAFLRRTFLEDLADGRKIYVCKRNDPPLTLDEVMPLFLALNRHADNRLLWVVPADDANPVGTVVEELPGLLRGHIDRFAPPEQVPTLSVPGWLAVCVNAWQLTGRRAWGAA
jgi:hypothetical protein